MIDDRMAVGVIDDGLMARIDPEIYKSSLKKSEMQADGFHRKGHEGLCLRGSDRH